MMTIELCCSPAAGQVWRLALQLPQDLSVRDALSGPLPDAWREMAAELIDLQSNTSWAMGVWGRKVHLSDVLKEGDRLEFYRPLVVDPKIARRQRFKGQGKGRTGLFARKRKGAVAGY
ncbi:MAG: RnfH family protein [Limnohabitans sp.]